MNGANWHLIVNHVPIFATLFGVVALIWSMLRKSSDMRVAAILLFILAAIMAYVANETGEMAEKVVESIPGVTKALVHEHEEAAEWAHRWAIAVGITSVLLAFANRFKKNLVKPVQILLLVMALLTAVTMVRTAFLGGKIRHSEIHSTSVAP